MEKRNLILSCRKKRQRVTLYLFFLMLMGSMSIPCFAQTGVQLKGTVSAEQNQEPLIGVNVMVKGANKGTITDFNGEFHLKVKLPCELVLSYMGYESRTVKVTKASDVFNLQLKEDRLALDEVVVVGYGVQKKKLLTGATVQVKGDDLQKLNTVSSLGALQSQTSGVNIVQNSGMPGEGFKVAIRGLGTTGSSSPLYIIDGVPGADINSLSPADIASIDVLKDAASAAIYGSRAANGVVLVTTKQGKVGKVSVTYDGYVGVQNVYKKPGLLNAQEYSKIQNEARMMDGLPAYDFASMVPNWDAVADGTWKGTNWFDEAINEDAPIQNHALNVTGGTERSLFSIGLSYTSQEGILGKPVTPEYNRYTFRMNSTHTLLKKNGLDMVKLGENFSGSYSKNAGIAIGNIWSNDIRNMMTTHPLLPMYNDRGDYHYAIDWESRDGNPIALMEKSNGQNESKSVNIKGNIFLEFNPIKNLKFKSSFGLVYSSGSYRGFIPKYKLSTVQQNAENQVTQSLYSGCSWVFENTMTYDFDLGEHHFKTLIGQSLEKNDMGESLSATNQNSIFSDFKHAYLVNTPITSGKTSLDGSPWGESSLASFFARATYDYKSKYMATLVLRADGSSNFKRGNRWGYFPSVSAGWTISEENFMQGTKGFLDFLKLRISWGQNGNQAIPNFQYLSTIAFTGAEYFFGTDKSKGTSGAYADVLPNEEVTWETSEQLNFGVDARFFGGKLGLNLDYYIKTTKDWLVNAPVLASYGTNAPYINGGDVRNEGLEISTSWNDAIDKLKYGINFNLSYNKNEVTRIANTEGIIHGAPNVLSQGTGECYRAQEGYPIGYFYGYQTAGVFQNQAQIDQYTGAKLPNVRPGDLIFKDNNGDGSINEKDKMMIGNPHPDFLASFNFNVSYKGFDLSATCSGAFGHQIMKAYRSFADLPKNNYTRDIFDRWHGERTSNRLPRLSSAASPNWQYVSDIYVENADYVKIKNITLGYDLKQLFKKLPLQQLRVYVAAQNLYTFTGYSGLDPEVGYGAGNEWVSGIDLGFYPSPRTYMMGVNVKF